MTKSLKIVNEHISFFKKCREIYAHASDIKSAKEYDDDIKIFETIKQDLERLEQLEKENQALRKGIDLDLNAKLLSENEKLEKTIKILKMQVDGCTISEQEDKLLNEVLKC